jgi:hypothetical protein
MSTFQTPEVIRAEAAAKVALLKDINLPVLKYWNYDGVCQQHLKDGSGQQVDCEYKACGGELFAHQRVGITWAYLARKGLLADDPGLGKTNIVLGLLALLKQRGEITQRAVIVVQTPSAIQWAKEAARWLPKMHVEVAVGQMNRNQRIQRYASNWDVLVIGYHTALRDRDLLEKMGPFALVASDDVDPLLDPSNATHQTIVALSRAATYSLTINATVLQTRLEQLWSALVPAGGMDVFGSDAAFARKYVKSVPVYSYRGGRKITVEKVVGYKNLLDLREKLKPMYLRRRADEVHDAKMPTLMPPVIEFLEMSKQQVALYKALQAETLILKKTDGSNYPAARVKFMSGQRICAGLPALGEADGPGASPKLDWLMHRLTTVWKDRKVVVYIKNPGLIEALDARLAAAGIGLAKIWGAGYGKTQTATARQEEIDKFWSDPKCRVIAGTSAMERSLNLQVSNTIVAVDTQINPARMRQVLGRIKRAGSRHTHVYFFTLLMANTQEDGYEKILSQRQALSDAVFEEETGLYAALSSIQMLNLISPGG